MVKVTCDFCNKAFQDRGGVIIDDNINYLISDISPIAINHLLIIPNIHYYSFARTNNQYLNELNIKISLIRDFFYFKNFNNFVFFEHGGPTCGDVDGCGIFHAHLHALSLPKIIDFEVEFYKYLVHRNGDLSFVKAENIYGLSFLKDYFYLMIINHHNEVLVFYSEQEFESQILRKFIAEKINDDYDYSWKKYYNPSLASICTNEFLLFLDQNKV